MPFKVQINYRYPDEGVHKGEEYTVSSFGPLKQIVLDVLQSLKIQEIEKASISIEYIPVKKED